MTRGILLFETSTTEHRLFLKRSRVRTWSNPGILLEVLVSDASVPWFLVVAPGMNAYSLAVHNQKYRAPDTTDDMVPCPIVSLLVRYLKFRHMTLQDMDQYM